MCNSHPYITYAQEKIIVKQLVRYLVYSLYPVNFRWTYTYVPGCSSLLEVSKSSLMLAKVNSVNLFFSCLRWIDQSKIPGVHLDTGYD